MIIKNLMINNIRIIKSIKINLNPQFTVFIGANASGKSSILEAITLLATGRSFRTNYFSEVITNNKKNALVVATVDNNIIGIQKDNKKTHIHINQQPGFKQHNLNNYLIIQIITTKIADLIESGSSARRNFIDWGLFHVKHDTKKTLHQFKKILQHRNALLRNSNFSEQDLLIWNKQFCFFGEKLNTARQQYLQQIIKNFNKKYLHLIQTDNIKIEFYKGWGENKTLLETLENNILKDKKAKSTKNGPHLADFKITINKQHVKNILSRGQIKTLSFLLKIAQLDLFFQQTNKKPIVLIDDICSELDKHNRQIILNCLFGLNTQIVLTSTDNIEISHGTTKFHVKHGVVNEITNEQ